MILVLVYNQKPHHLTKETGLICRVTIMVVSSKWILKAINFQFQVIFDGGKLETYLNSEIRIVIIFWKYQNKTFIKVVFQI